MSTSLSSKTALVTGASRGIGRATALALASRGAYGLVHYRSGAAEAASIEETTLNDFDELFGATRADFAPIYPEIAGLPEIPPDRMLPGEPSCPEPMRAA